MKLNERGMCEEEYVRTSLDMCMVPFITETNILMDVVFGS